MRRRAPGPTRSTAPVALRLAGGGRRPPARALRPDRRDGLARADAPDAAPPLGGRAASTPAPLADVARPATGRPIRYGCTDTAWPLADYQTLFAAPTPHAHRPRAARRCRRPAGRSRPSCCTALIAAGVVFAPITLHTGVSSLEAHEPPYAERYQVPATTARLVNEAHAAGHRVIAVGHHRHPGPRDRRRRRRRRPRRRRLDRARHHPRARPATSSTASSAAGTSPRPATSS